jgi:hypothetical protein
MGYSPPLIKPPPLPLRPPVAPPYRPPGTNPLPPTQTAPIYQPPDLLPPTDRDLKGDICIYSNPPIWEPKYIRYRYPGESWQNVAGDRFTLEEKTLPPSLPILDNGIYRISNLVATYRRVGTSNRNLIIRENAKYINLTGALVGGPIGEVTVFEESHGGNPFIFAFVFRDTKRAPGSDILRIRLNSEFADYFAHHIYKSFTYDIALVSPGTRTPPPTKQCTFKVFDRFDQEVVSITRDDCPEAFVVPEICYFKPENEKLVKKVTLSANMSLRTEYAANCSIVWLDLSPLNYFPIQIYKECSTSPTCPPPRIRFDKKCSEDCEACPPGTAVRVLLGSKKIACVDAAGCIKKMIKYIPGCNGYDCICL